MITTICKRTSNAPITFFHDIRAICRSGKILVSNHDVIRWPSLKQTRRVGRFICLEERIQFKNQPQKRAPTGSIMLKQKIGDMKTDNLLTDSEIYTSIIVYYDITFYYRGSVIDIILAGEPIKDRLMKMHRLMRRR